MEPIRVGLAGYGNWAREAYTPILQGLNAVEVSAVAARSEKTRELARQAFGTATKTFATYDELLGAASIDAVLIALPNDLHSDAIQAAIASGKHVFFEPPVSLDEPAAKRALDAMAASNATIQADLELRYLPVLDRVCELIDSGSIGSPRLAKIRLWCNWGHGGGEWMNEVQNQSFFLWLGTWYLDVLDTVFATAPTSAHVVGGHAMNGRLLDHGWALLTYPDERCGQFEFNLITTANTDIRVHVAGTAGEISADLVTGDYRWRTASDSWKEGRTPASQPPHGFEGMRESLHGFFESIRSGNPVRANAEVCRRVHAAAFACVRSEPLFEEK